MITTGSKWFYGFGAVTLVLAAIYGWSTGGNGLGPVTAGYKGGVGDHFGYGILLAAATLSIFLGLVLTAVRDADAAAVAELVGRDTPPAALPAPLSYWPAVGAFGAAVLVIGLVVEPFLFAVGAVIVVIALGEWTVQNWSDRATGDPIANREIRNRLMYPVEIPVAGALIVGAVVLSVSRVFLAVSAASAVWVATGVAVAVLAVGAAIAARPRVRSDVVAGVLAFAAVAILAAGVIGAAVGEREFHEKGTESESQEHP